MRQLQIIVPMENDVDGLEIRCDGVLIPVRNYAVAVGVDAGTHTLLAQAAGRIPWFTQVRIDPGPTTVTVTIPRLNAEISTSSAPPTGAPAAPARKLEPDTGKTERTLGLVLGGAGVVGVAVGAWLGFDARAAQREDRNRCALGPCLQGTNDPDRFYTQAAIGDTLIALGLASCVGGAIFFLTAPSAPPPERRTAGFNVAPSVTPNGASVVAVGRF
jgi:serine/threonine-protein kinase